MNVAQAIWGAMGSRGKEKGKAFPYNIFHEADTKCLWLCGISKPNYTIVATVKSKKNYPCPSKIASAADVNKVGLSICSE